MGAPRRCVRSIARRATAPIRAAVARRDARGHAVAGGVPSSTARPHRRTDTARAHRLDTCCASTRCRCSASHNSYHARPYPEVLAALPSVDPADRRRARLRPPPAARAVRRARRARDRARRVRRSRGRQVRRPRPADAARRRGARTTRRCTSPASRCMHQADIDTQRRRASRSSICLDSGAGRGRTRTRATSPMHGPDRDEGRRPTPSRARRARRRDPLACSPRDEIVTPDDVRGDAADARRSGARRAGWPTLGEMRGKVLLHARQRRAARRSTSTGHPSLEGRGHVHAVVAGRRRRRVREAERPDRRRGDDPGRARRQHGRAHACRRRHGPGARQRHDDARRRARERRAVREHRLRGAESGVLDRTPCRSRAAHRRAATR